MQGTHKLSPERFCLKYFGARLNLASVPNSCCLSLSVPPTRLRNPNCSGRTPLYTNFYPVTEECKKPYLGCGWPCVNNLCAQQILYLKLSTWKRYEEILKYYLTRYVVSFHVLVNFLVLFFNQTNKRVDDTILKTLNKWHRN